MVAFRENKEKGASRRLRLRLSDVVDHMFVTDRVCKEDEDNCLTAHHRPLALEASPTTTRQCTGLKRGERGNTVWALAN